MVSNKELKEASTDLFEKLNECLLEGGYTERYARLGLARHGFRVRRLLAMQRFRYRPRGLAPVTNSKERNHWDCWTSGDSRTGLKLVPFLTGATAAERPSGGVPLKGYGTLLSVSPIGRRAR